MKFVTSDLHFNNSNIIKYCNRPYSSVEEMNAALINNWNAVVSPSDTTFVLGDFIMGDPNTVTSIINSLNGEIKLIRGNHDTEKKLEQYYALGVEVFDFHHFAHKGRHILMCHFPVQSNEWWNMIVGSNAEMLFLYGHIHDKAPSGIVDGMFHVGVDTNEFTPVSLDEIVSRSRA